MINEAEIYSIFHFLSNLPFQKRVLSFRSPFKQQQRRGHHRKRDQPALAPPSFAKPKPASAPSKKNGCNRPVQSIGREKLLHFIVIKKYKFHPQFPGPDLLTSTAWLVVVVPSGSAGNSTNSKNPKTDQSWSALATARWEISSKMYSLYLVCCRAG